MIMLTRSSKRIFNSSHYTGKYYGKIIKSLKTRYLRVSMMLYSAYKRCNFMHRHMFKHAPFKKSFY